MIIEVFTASAIWSTEWMSAEAERERRMETRTLAIRQQFLEVDRLPPPRVSRLRKPVLACWRFAIIQMTVTRLSLWIQKEGIHVQHYNGSNIIRHEE